MNLLKLQIFTLKEMYGRLALTGKGYGCKDLLDYAKLKSALLGGEASS